MRVPLWALLAGLVFTGCKDPASNATKATDQFHYAELDISDLQARMQRGELDSRTLTTAYLGRIDALNRQGPRLAAVIETNSAALKEATLLDEERKHGKTRGPLHGIPLLLKDSIDATPMSNSAGSLALADYRPARDAFLVQRLRAAGAVILGKSNLSEWSNFRSSHPQSGWSARGGQTRNPYLLNHGVCGSNAGTATAVSANLAVAAIGVANHSDMSCPAADNGVVALRPSVGLISRHGVIPLSFSQDTPGPITRNVADAALLLSIISGRDPNDPATGNAAWNSASDYLSHLKPEALRGARIGVLRNRFTTDPEAAVAMETAIKILREAGATVVDAHIATDGQWHEDERTLLLYEFKAGLNRYLSSTGAPIRSLEALIAFNREHASQELTGFDQNLLEMAQAKGGLGEAEYISARSRARRLAGLEGIDSTLKAQRLDALVSPAIGSAHAPNLDASDATTFNVAAVAGYPALTLPIGHNQTGLPLGMVIIGPAWSEARLLAYAYAYEQKTLARNPPGFHSAQPSGQQ